MFFGSIQNGTVLLVTGPEKSEHAQRHTTTPTLMNQALLSSASLPDQQTVDTRIRSPPVQMEDDLLIWEVSLMNGDTREFPNVPLSDVRAHCVRWLQALGTCCVKLFDSANPNVEARGLTEGFPASADAQQAITYLDETTRGRHKLLAVHITDIGINLDQTLRTWGVHSWQREIRSAIIAGDCTVLRRMWAKMLPTQFGTAPEVRAMQHLLMGLELCGKRTLQRAQQLSDSDFFSLLEELPFCTSYGDGYEAMNARMMKEESASWFSKMPDLLETARYIAIIKKFLEKGLDINFVHCDSNGRTMLHTVALNLTTQRGVEKITQLLELGAKQIQFDTDYKTASDLLLQRAEIDLVDQSRMGEHICKKGIPKEVKNAALAIFFDKRKNSLERIWTCQNPRTVADFDIFIAEGNLCGDCVLCNSVFYA